MKTVGGAKIPSASCRILATTNCFAVLFVKMRCELSEIRGTERLFIDMFGHDVQQPSPSRDVNRT